MERIRVAIVDDEEIIRKGLKSLLIVGLPDSEIAEYADGELALKAFLDNTPDIVFLDINMPFLNGLECIETLKKYNKNPLVIIISGYDDFMYTQKAIQLGIFNYILKPISEQVFFETVKNAKKELKNRKLSAQYLQWAKNQLASNKEFLVTKLMKNILQHCYDSIEIKTELEYLNIDIKTPFTFFLIKFFFKEIDTFLENEWNENLVFYATQELVKKIFIDYEPILFFQIADFSAGVMCSKLSLSEQILQKDILKSELEKCMPYTVIIASEVCENYETIADLYDNFEVDVVNIQKTPLLITKALEYVNQNYTNNLLSIQDIADYLKISPQHLSRLFKSTQGKTFIEYVTLIRIQKSLKYLEQSNYKIYEIAEKIGYSTQHYFCTAFKRVLHISPQEYRKSLLNY